MGSKYLSKTVELHNQLYPQHPLEDVDIDDIVEALVIMGDQIKSLKQEVEDLKNNRRSI